MPDLGKYEKIPRPESIQKLIGYLSANNNVSSISHNGGQLLSISRSRLSDLTVFLTNIYIVGEADAREILSQNSEINAIVTMSAWNGYSSEAKRFCNSKNVGLFKFGELLGAVHYDGRQFLDYIPPHEREVMRRRNRSI